MKSVFRPFWSYDLHKTEGWLDEMASQGWLLEGWNVVLRRFMFRKGKPCATTYQIGYDHSGAGFSSGLLAQEGWTTNLHHRKWMIYKNERPSGQINAFPSRKAVMKRNRKISYFFTGILVYLLFISLIPLLTIGLSLFQEAPLQIEKSPMWLVTGIAAAFAIALFILSLYSLSRIRAGSEKLLQEHRHNQNNAEHEDIIKPTGQTVTSIKLGWMYSPDQLEKWLEYKESVGYNLYKVGRLGTLFYFSKGSPRHMAYHADYQLTGDEEYYNLHREAGWKSVYSSFSSLQKWTIWSREYSAGEERPQMYSDPFHRLKHARKIALSYSLLFLPILLLYALNIQTFIDVMRGDGFSAALMLNTSLQFICMIVFGSFAGRTWLYYRRLQKQ